MGVKFRDHPTGRKATASDVARAAGVSKWTVGRAFQKDASIAEESRMRVLVAADRLGYRPNLLARSLATKSTNQVAVLVDDFGNPHKLPMLSLLTRALQRDGRVATLINIEEPDGLTDALLNADQRQVDAVILLGTAFRDEMLHGQAAHPAAPPLFVLARESELASVTAVSCDSGAAMEAIVAHLWERGYRRPGFLSGPRTLSTALGRRRDFSAGWRQRGIAHVVEIPAGAYATAAGAAALRRYLTETAAADRVDVVMGENDALAFGALDVARFGFGLRVPADLAVVGFDGVELTASPAYDLTTYQQPMASMVDHLVAMIVGRAPPASANLPGRLVVRGST